MTTVARELQQKFHRVSVSLSDDGQVVRAHMPPMEDLPTTLEDPVTLQSYQDLRVCLIANFGEAPTQCQPAVFGTTASRRAVQGIVLVSGRFREGC